MRTWMRLQYFLFFFTWTTFVSYWGLIFADRGFDSTEIGLSITVSLVTRSVAVVTLFPLANRHLPLGAIARVLPWLCLLVATALVPDAGFTGLMVLSALLGILYPTEMQVLETAGSLGAQRGAFEYGPARMWGSFGFIVGSAVDGAIATVLGTGALLWVFIGGLLVLALAALRPMGDEVVAAQRAGSFGSWGPLLTRPVIVCALGAAVVLQSSHAAYYAFGTLHLDRLGAAPWAIAAMLVLAPLGEMAVFRLLGGAAAGRSIAVLLAGGVVGCVLRWTLWALVPSWPVLLASQLMHGLTFGLIQLAVVQTLRRHVSPELVGPAQGLYAALGTGGGTAVMTAVAGHYFDLSPALTILLMAACAGLAAPLVWGLARAESRGGPLQVPPRPLA